MCSYDKQCTVVLVYLDLFSWARIENETLNSKYNLNREVAEAVWVQFPYLKEGYNNGNLQGHCWAHIRHMD